MSENSIKKNFETYKNGLIKLLGEDVAIAIIEALGGEEKIANATYSNLENSGSSFNGSFVKNVIRLAKYANSINDILPENNKADKNSINKVCLLSQISKVILFEENDNNWEIVNRGINYKYAQLNGALRVGERSILIAMNAGVKFNEFEFEAMRILDKTGEDDNYTKYFSSSLSTVVRQASEIITLINKKLDNE